MKKFIMAITIVLFMSVNAHAGFGWGILVGMAISDDGSAPKPVSNSLVYSSPDLKDVDILEVRTLRCMIYSSESNGLTYNELFEKCAEGTVRLTGQEKIIQIRTVEDSALYKFYYLKPKER